MGHLDKMDISNRIIDSAKRRRKSVDTVEYRRDKLIANIEEQIELAQLSIDGKPLVLKRKRGHKVVSVKPRIWWATEPDGLIFVQIRYNKVPLNLAGRGTAINVGRLARLPRILRTVIKAVQAGELDQAIQNAARKSRP